MGTVSTSIEKISLNSQLIRKLYEVTPGVRTDLENFFQSLSAAKKKAGVYEGPHTRKQFRSMETLEILIPDENEGIYLSSRCL